MKHIGVHGFSRKGPQPADQVGSKWRVHGLGDRAMIIMMALNYAKRHDTQVTIHFNKEHTMFKDSWEELLTLVPKDTLFYKWHSADALKDGPWLEYLKVAAGANVSLYYFGLSNENSANNAAHGAYPNIYADTNIHDYINKSPLMPSTMTESPFPDQKYMVQQWDAKEVSRQMLPPRIKIVQDHFIEQGYKIVTIGGAADKDDPLNYSLKHIGNAIYHSDGYIGGNSGMMWMSALYKNYEDIWFWGKMKHNHVQFLSELANFNKITRFKNKYGFE